jgi:hypothetical protein
MSFETSVNLYDALYYSRQYYCITEKGSVLYVHPPRQENFVGEIYDS